MPTFDVTVVIPTHARAAYVRAAVESVLSQTLAPSAIVVIGDGPDQPTRDALADLPIQYVETPPGGVSQARNVGVALARTTWVAFLDDDNLWHPELLAKAADYVAAHDDVRALNTGYWVFSDNLAAGLGPDVDFTATSLVECLAQAGHAVPRTSLAHLDIRGSSFARMLARMAGSMSSALVQRDLLFQAGGFPAGSICAEDWTMFTNVARLAEWHLLPDRLAFLRVHGTNNTSARGLLNGPATLRAIAAAWEDESRPWPSPRPRRRDYRGAYRFTLRDALITARTTGRWDVYVECLLVGRRLLGPLDVLRAMFPVPLRALLRRG